MVAQLADMGNTGRDSLWIQLVARPNFSPVAESGLCAEQLFSYPYQPGFQDEIGHSQDGMAVDYQQLLICMAGLIL